VIVTVTLNAALEVSYASGRLSWDSVSDVSRPRYRASGRGVAVARVLHKFGHDVLATGLAGGTSGELIRADLARSGIAADFTMIGRESRRVFGIVEGDTGRELRFREPGPYVTTEELGRFAADYRRLLADATAIVLCGSLPTGLPPEIYGSLVTYAAEAGVPVVLDAGGEELRHGARRRPALVIPDDGGDGAAATRLLALGPGAVAVPAAGGVHAATRDGEWAAAGPPDAAISRGALVAGLVPGLLLGWSWPDRLRHALALAHTTGPAGDVDLASYEQLLSGDQLKVVER
jgi:tagatose 6-phosphate kinase